MTYARLRPKRSPSLLPIRMKAAETSASMATADCTPLTVVSRSSTTAEIETFISDVSMTKTNIAIARRRPSRGVPGSQTTSPASIPHASGASGGPVAASQIDDVRSTPIRT